MTEEEKKLFEKIKWKSGYGIRTQASFDVIEEMEGTKAKEKAIEYQGELEFLIYLIEKLHKKIIPTKYYACDPKKHKKCKKKHCYINGGECDATIDETKVKYINLEDYIPKELQKKQEIEYDGMIQDFIDYLTELLGEE